MRFLSLAVCFLAFAVIAPAQVVINEFVYDDSSTDDREFVEIYNAGPATVNIGDWTLENQDEGGLNTGSPVTIPTSTMLAPGAFYVVGDTAVANTNQVQASGWLQNSKEAVVLRDSGGNIVDAVAYETNKTTALDPMFIEGTGIWGNFTSIDGQETSWGRWFDGLDTNDNGADFGMRSSTPGTSNNVGSLLPYSENYDALLPGMIAAGFGGSFVLPTVTDPTVASAQIVNPVAVSPQGGNAVVIWDPAGGGDMAFLDTTPIADYDIECFVYLHAGDIGGDLQGWSIGVRGTTGTYYNIPQLGAANGNTGICWRYYSEGPTGALGGAGAFLELVDEGVGGADEILATIPIIAGTNDGWQRLRLSVAGQNINANFGGTFGNPATGQTFSYCTLTTNIGTPYFGYRESAPLSGTANAYPLLIDGLDISFGTATSCVPQFQLNQTASTLLLDGISGTFNTGAVSTQPVSGTGMITFASSQVGFPWDAAISFEALVSATAGGITSANGQIVNINVVTPVAPLLWLNGGALPNLGTTAFPAPTFPGLYIAPAAPGSAAIQMIVVDPTNPDNLALSQGCQLETL